jgi:hypothetical protein
MKNIYLSIGLLLLIGVANGQTTQQLKDSAATFPPMPRGTADLLPFTTGLPTFASGGPFNDLDFTLFDTDYMDGENSGSDVFMPVDPADPVPGADRVKYIRCILNTDLNQVYGSADADRIILGTHEIDIPFFLRGADSLDNDYAVIQHLDFEAGYIQLKGSAADYDLIYCTQEEGCETEGWYLFYTAEENIDLIAFIFPCWDIEPSVSGNPPNNPNPICNADSTLSLTNPVHFKYAAPIETELAVEDGIAQFGSNGKEVLGGMATDAAGNAYLFGLTDGNLDGNADAENEIFIIKLDANGEQQWVTELPMAEGTILKDGIADDQFLYVCGRTLGSLPGFANAGRWDGILLKLELANGQIVASDQWGNAGIDGYGNLEQDDNGHIFVSAQGSPAGAGGTDDVYLVAKHRKSDLSNVWRALNAPNASGFIASAEAWGGLTYVPGDSPGDGRLIAAGWYFSATGANAFVSVYEGLNNDSPSRPYSEIINTMGIRADWVLDNAVDAEENIYVAGFTTGNLGAPPAGEGDAYLIKYSPQLTNPRFQQFGTERCDLIRKLLIQNDTLYAVGYTYGDLAGPNADPAQASGDVFVQKLDKDLNLLEAVQFGTPHEDRAYGAFASSHLYIGGMTEGYMMGESAGSFDGFLAALHPSDLSFVPPVVLSANAPQTLDEVLIFPNPTSGSFRIWPADGIRQITLFDLTGNQLRVLSPTSLDISIADLPDGMYILKIDFAEASVVRRLIKQ